MGLGPSLAGELLVSCRNEVSRCTCCVVCVVYCCVVLCCGAVVVVCGHPEKSNDYTCRLSVLVEFLNTLTVTALRKKSLCQTVFETVVKKTNKQKNKNNETSSSTCGQQFIMKCHEHNK